MEWMSIPNLMLRKHLYKTSTRARQDTSAETRKLEDKLDALVNLVTQLATNQKPASIARVCGIGSSNNHHSSVYPSSQQSGQFSARNDTISIRGVHDVATDTYAETRKLEGKLDAHVNLFSGRNDAIVIRGVHDVATDTSADTRKLEGKLDALVILVIQLAAYQKPAFVARVCSIRSSNDHHTSVCPSSQQSRLDEHPEAYAANTYSRPIQQQREVFILLRCNLEWMSILRLMLQTPIADHHSSRYKAPDREDDSKFLALRIRSLPLVARVCGINSSIDHHASVCPSSQQSRVDEHPKAYAANTYSKPPQQKLEGKLDAFVNLVTQLDTNQKPASIATVWGIRSSNDHHTSACHFSHQSGANEHPEAYAANNYSRPPHQQRQGT
ncbi:hypothetical protein Fmac_015315 [Flemingia macrophylla]|uniref:Uncharacterized protein n=1 Tax=Flemingia macrophylla TaxID=520843 RepID=A0ABD1MEB0_9FABA